MAQVNVTFTFHSGIKRQPFQNVRLSGSWDGARLFSTQWTLVPCSHRRTVPAAMPLERAYCSMHLRWERRSNGVVRRWSWIAKFLGGRNRGSRPQLQPDDSGLSSYGRRRPARVPVRNRAQVRCTEIHLTGRSKAWYPFCGVGALCPECRSGLRAFPTRPRNPDRLDRGFSEHPLGIVAWSQSTHSRVKGPQTRWFSRGGSYRSASSLNFSAFFQSSTV
jgi:hypothetical protein